MGAVVGLVGSKGLNARWWGRELLRAGYSLRWLEKNLMAAARVGANQELVHLDLDRPETMDRALAGVSILCLVTPAHPRQVLRERALIEKSASAGVERIIKLSVIGADLARPISAFARWQREVELTLMESSLSYVLLRANSFMQNLLAGWSSILNGVYREPLDSSRTSLIDVRDVARIAAAVADGRCDGRTLTLTGPLAQSGEDIAQTLSACLHREILYVSSDLDQFGENLMKTGAPSWRVEALMDLYRAVQEGRAPHLAEISNDFRNVIGEPPRALKSFVNDVVSGVFGRVTA